MRSDKGYLLDEPVWVNLPFVKAVSVDDVPLEARDFLAVYYLCRAAPRLGVLSGHPPDPDDPLLGAPDEHEAHLQQQLDLGLDAVLLAVGEELGAVAALQEEGIALGDV